MNAAEFIEKAKTATGNEKEVLVKTLKSDIGYQDWVNQFGCGDAMQDLKNQNAFKIRKQKLKEMIGEDSVLEIFSAICA